MIKVRLGRMIREGSPKGSFAVITVKRNKTANINVKKLQFIHKLTASDTSKTAKITKDDITQQHIVDSVDKRSSDGRLSQITGPETAKRLRQMAVAVFTTSSWLTSNADVL